jgi:hypothetical protein
MIGRAILFAAALEACGGSSPSGDGGANRTISGSVQGIAWTDFASALWIGKPSAGSPPVIVFVLEAPTPCTAISAFNWDKFIGDHRVLEIATSETTVRAFHIPSEATVAYLRGAYNPDADAGTVTVTALDPAKRLTGTFDAAFGGDRLAGTFEAAYCPDGVEP